MRALERGLTEQNAVVRHDPHRVAVNAGEAGHQRGAVFGLELGELAAVDDAGDHLVHVVRHPRVDGHDVVQLGLVGHRVDRRRHLPRQLCPRSQRGDDAAHDPQRVAVVVRQMVCDTGGLGVQVAAAEVFGRHHLAGRGLHQRWAAEEDGALVAHDHRLVAHRRHVRTAGGARPEDRGDLRDTVGGQVGLVVEDAAEVLAVGEHLVLARQERSPGVDQVDARQAVLSGDLLCAQVLLDGDRVVRAALHRRVVGHDHALATRDSADAGDHSRAGTLVVVHAVGGQRRQFQEGAAGVEQPVDAVAGQQLAAADVALAGAFRTAECRGGQLGAQLVDQREVLVAMCTRRAIIQTRSFELMTTNSWYVSHD